MFRSLLVFFFTRNRQPRALQFSGWSPSPAQSNFRFAQNQNPVKLSLHHRSLVTGRTWHTFEHHRRQSYYQAARSLNLRYPSMVIYRGYGWLIFLVQWSHFFSSMPFLVQWSDIFSSGPRFLLTGIALFLSRCFWGTARPDFAGHFLARWRHFPFGLAVSNINFFNSRGENRTQDRWNYEVVLWPKLPLDQTFLAWFFCFAVVYNTALRNLAMKTL